MAGVFILAAVLVALAGIFVLAAVLVALAGIFALAAVLVALAGVLVLTAVLVALAGVLVPAAVFVLLAGVLVLTLVFVLLADAFEKLKPLFSLLRDGYYMLVDTYLCPTDGGNRVFWDIDSIPRELPAFNRRTDFFDSDYGQSPHYCYPSKWPSYYSEDAPELWDAENFDEREAPRAIGYAVSSTMVLLLDGHYKAMNHLELSDLAPCLVIIPHMKDIEMRKYLKAFFLPTREPRQLISA